MIHKISHHARRIHHHVFPHLHEDGQQHHAHGLSLVALFAYLQVFVFTIGGFYVIKLTAPQILGAVTFTAGQIVELTNAKRAENGVGAVVYNPLLAQAASAKANNMLSENYWAHFSPSGKSPWSFMNSVGYKYVYAGENLARDFGDAQSVVNAWMNSPSHKSNLLDRGFKEIGVAVTSGNLTGHEGILVVQMFATPVSQVPTQQNLAQASPVPSPTLAPSPSPSPIRNLFAQVTPVPTPTPTPEPSPPVSPSPVAVAEADVIGPQDVGQSATVLASNQFSISKGITLGLVGFIFLLFALEVMLVMRREHLKLRSGILAHLGILAFVLLVIWYAVSGAIL